MTIYVTDEWKRVGRGWPFIRRADIRTGLKVTVQPSSEPIDIATARQHLKLATSGSPASNPDDSLISGIFIPAAREACENYLGRALAPQFFSMTLDRFPFACFSGTYDDLLGIELPMGPLLGVESVQYYDTSAVLQTLDTTVYDVDTYNSRITLAHNQTWPQTLIHPTAVTISYQSGYSLPDGSPQDYQMPQSIRAAILLTLSQIYDRCQEGNVCDINDVPVAVKYLLDPYRVRLGIA